MKDFRIASLAITLISVSLFFSVFSAQSYAYVSLTFSSSTIPSTIDPGSKANLLLTITNAGTEVAGLAKLNVRSTQYVSADASLFDLGSINAGGSSQTTIPITVSANSPEGISALPFTVSYSVGSSAGTVSTDNSATITVTKRVLIELTSVTYDKSIIQRGDTINMTMTLQNVGKGQIKDLTVSLRNFTSLPVSPATGDTEKFVGTLMPGGNATVDFGLAVSVNADTLAYSLPISLSYFDDQGISQSATKYVGLKISGIPNFVVSIEKEDNVFAGAAGTLTISIANSGTGSAKFLTVSAAATDSDVSPKSNYIGNMDPDDTNTITLDVKPTSTGTHHLTLHLAYKDSYNQDFTKDYPLDFTVSQIPISIPLPIQILVAIVVLAVIYFKRSSLIKFLRRK
jgi:hypothetical protein